MDDPQTEIGGNGRQLPVTSDTALASIRSGDPLRRDESFDSAWPTVVLDRATRLLGERLDAQGKRTYFEVFKRYDLEAVDGATSYESIARELRISVDDVKNYLTRSREEFRNSVRSILCESVGSPEDLSQEWEALFGGS